MFSKACEYGIKAVIYIATQSQKSVRVKIGDIAKEIDSPVAFTAKILGSLVKRGIVQSQTGPNGGFYIDTHRMDKIPLKDIVIAIDGDSVLYDCALGLKRCNDKEPCPLHHKYIHIRRNLIQIVEKTSVLELTEGLASGKTILASCSK